MSITSYQELEFEGWKFKMSADKYMKSVMLVSYNEEHTWSSVKFFKCIEDATFYANYVNIQAKMLKE